jgi:integrase
VRCSGLRWSEVDLDYRRLSVVRSLTSVNYRVTVLEPKTAKGRRAVALDAASVAVLRAHGLRQANERQANVATWQDTGLVFTHEDGSPVHPHRLTAWFEQRRLAAVCPRSGYMIRDIAMRPPHYRLG